MAASLNKVTLIGHLGRDPEARNTQDGAKIVNFTLATSESWNDRASGERKELTEWHRVVIFNERLAEIAERFLKKGSKVYIEGALQTRKWADQSGNEKYTTEIVLGTYSAQLLLLGDPGRGEASAEAAPDDAPRAPSTGTYAAAKAKGGAPYARAAAPPRPRVPEVELVDDEIPF